MKDNFSELLKDNMVRLLLTASLFLLIIHVFLVAWFYPKLPPYIPFFNSMPWGEARLIPASLILSVPIMITTIFVGNLLISSFLYIKYPLIVRILQFNSLLFIFLSFLAFLQIIFLVF